MALHHRATGFSTRQTEHIFDNRYSGQENAMTCPVCDCEYFYVKDPDNPSKYYQFKCDDGDITDPRRRAGLDPGCVRLSSRPNFLSCGALASFAAMPPDCRPAPVRGCADKRADRDFGHENDIRGWRFRSARRRPSVRRWRCR